jgi:hypothetical protein
MNMENEAARVRAWVLILADDPSTTSEEILALDQGENDLVVVRADTVDGGFINLVAAIDCDENYFETAKGDLMALPDIQNIWFLEVTAYNPGNPEVPNAPQDATGFITGTELEVGDHQGTLELSAGRQDHSPGFNPWG